MNQARRKGRNLRLFHDLISQGVGSGGMVEETAALEDLSLGGLRLRFAPEAMPK